MTPAIIIDVIIAAILIAAVLIGTRKGLFLSLAGIMIFLLALVGANIGAKSLSVPLADQLTPKIQERIAVRVEDTLQEKNQQSNESLEQMLPDSLKSILEHTGLLNKLKDVLGQSTKGTIAEISSAIAAAIARELAETFLYGILFLLLFLALLVLLWLAARGINLLLKLPVLSGMNASGRRNRGAGAGSADCWPFDLAGAQIGNRAADRRKLSAAFVLGSASVKNTPITKHFPPVW